MMSLEDRLWSRVDRSGDCWVWTGQRLPAGYGQLRCGGRRRIYTHRLAWTLAYGEIPAGLFVLHRCDNPPCCNPAHLWLGDAGDNIRDCFAKNRNGASTRRRTRPQ